MPISLEVGKWLGNNGYRNLCFVSYAREAGMTEFATTVQAEIQSELRYQVPEASVFIDHRTPPGAIWPEHLKANLAGSLAMVAILSQIYFSDRHTWCGREWGAMESLSAARLPPSSTMHAIIPVLFRKTVLPDSARHRQCLDLTRNSVVGKRFFSTQAFRRAIQSIVAQIEELALLVYDGQLGASTSQCTWPEQSPFVGFAVPPQPHPLFRPPCFDVAHVFSPDRNQ